MMNIHVFHLAHVRITAAIKTKEGRKGVAIMMFGPHNIRTT